jgi:hypothetical protein
MQSFKASGHEQRFLSVHGQVHNFFRVGRHLLSASNHKFLRSKLFEHASRFCEPVDWESASL